MNTKIAIPTFLVMVSFAFLLMHNPFQAKTHQPFHINGQLSHSSQDVFEKLHQQITTLHDANSYAQKHLLRTGERWDKQHETPVHQYMKENRSSIIAALKNLGMIDQVEPEKKHYIYAGLMGALVVYRMNYLQELINAGYTFEYIVLLGGSRPLQQKEKDNLPETITTEAEMMVYLFNNSKLKNKKMILVDAPMIQKADGSYVRPTTDDTLVHFAKIAPQDGSFLVISNNPYALRQTKVAQRILDQKRFPTQGAGKKADVEKIDIIMLMDEFARALYEENKQFSAQAV